MGQRLIISEEERSRISGMYGLVNEQQPKLSPPTAPKPQPKEPQPSVKLQVFDNDKKLVMLIEIDRTSVKHNNLKSEFNYKVRGGSGEYTGYFNTRKPNKVELDRCQLFNDRVIKRDYTEFAVAECPEDSWHEFNLSPEGSRVMDKLFGKEGRYASNDSGEDMSNMA